MRKSQRSANVAYCLRNRQRERARVRVRQAGTIELLRDLRRVPCADCQRRYRPQQMDFDHRDPGDKSFRLTSGRAMLMSNERLLAEVAKCDVVCANCHRIRTQQRHAKRLRTQPRGTSKALVRHRASWRAQARLLDAFRAVPCHDCGRRLPPCAMDFDHRDPSEKVASVTRMIGRAGVERILAEVAKCDIVCANCHRARTMLQRVRAGGRE